MKDQFNSVVLICILFYLFGLSFVVMERLNGAKWDHIFLKRNQEYMIKLLEKQTIKQSNGIMMFEKEGE